MHLIIKCSTKPLSKLVTCIQSYCDTSYSWDGVNQMWFWRTLKICKEYIEPSSLSSCNNKEITPGQQNPYFILMHLIIHFWIKLVFSLLPQILHLYLKKADVIFFLFFFYCRYIVHYAMLLNHSFNVSLLL
jgi:hypothetical protein